MNSLFESALTRGYGILALVPVVCLIGACSEEVVEQAAVVRPINILTVGGLGGGEVLKYPAEIRPIQNADLAFEVPGRLIELPVVEGEDVQAGQAIHLNYAVAYQVTDILRLGVAGYYLNQFKEDDYSGAKAKPFEKDSEEEVFAIGPGLVLHINKDLTFMGAVNFETGAENRPEGVRSILRLIWKFR